MKIKWSVYYLVIFSVSMLFVAACNKATAPLSEHELNLPPLKGIDHHIRDNVFVSQGAAQRIIIEAQSEAFKGLNKTVENGIWKIDFDKKPNLYRNMKILITVPDLNSIQLAGPGMVITQKMRLDSIYLQVTGTGNIDLEADTRILHGAMMGNGDLFLEGKSNQGKLNVVSQGRIHAFDMPFKSSEIIMEGNGIANVSVNDTLNARILGTGSVFYKGNPVLQTVSTNSGGSIIKVD